MSGYSLQAMPTERRFEQRVEIELRCWETGRCAGKPMQLRGNLSLRGAAGATTTQLGYKCETCFRRVMVTDAWYGSSPEVDAAHDTEP